MGLMVGNGSQPTTPRPERLIMETGNIVRYTPEGNIDDRWVDWYGLVTDDLSDSRDPVARDHMVMVHWRNDNTADPIMIRIKDLTVIS